MQRANEKATRQLGGLFFQGRIVPTEAKFRQNFLPKSYEPKNRGVKRFLGNKCHCFQSLTKWVNTRQNCTKLRQRPVEGSKPILLRHLARLEGDSGHLRYAPRTGFGEPFDRRFGQVQRDEFHLFRAIKHLVGIHALHQNADSAERYSGNDRESRKNRAQNRRCSGSACTGRELARSRSEYSR